jgi:hypothetical protein
MDIQAMILSLLTDGAPALLVSGWISTHWTHATGIPAQLQSWAVAIALVLFGSLVGYIPIPVGEVWTWLIAGFTNGLIANLIYKSGFLDNILVGLRAKAVS